MYRLTCGFLCSWKNDLEDLFKRCRDTRVHLWVCALPLLHHRTPSALTRSDMQQQSESAWAGLKRVGLPKYREIRTEQ